MIKQGRKEKIKQWICIFILICFIVGGLVLDYAYWKKMDIRQLSDLVMWLKAYNITYHGALDILRGNVGVLMTIVSLFLTMNINIAERSEKKVFGMYRKELFNHNENFVYLLLKRINYFVPVLMLIFLNLSFCVSGYLFFCYSYAFLLMHYFIHNSSYSSDRDKSVVVQKLVDSLPSEQTESDWTGNMLLHYQTLLGIIGQSAESDGNWKDIEDLYFRFLESIQIYGEQESYIICTIFYQNVYWENKKGSEAACLQVLKRVIEEECMNSNQWPILWGMLQGIIYEADENILEKFLYWFFEYEKRSKNVLKRENHSLSTDIINEQAGAILIFMEYRVRDKLLESSKIEAYLHKLWILGRTFFLNEDDLYDSRISLLIKNRIFDSTQLDEIYDDLRDDYCKHTKKSLIANIIIMDGEEDESRNL